MCIARVLAEPEVILMDEPASAFDPLVSGCESPGSSSPALS
jgi:ABC-type phosphate transport system ATPase subunit